MTAPKDQCHDMHHGTCDLHDTCHYRYQYGAKKGTYCTRATESDNPYCGAHKEESRRLYPRTHDHRAGACEYTFMPPQGVYLGMHCAQAAVPGTVRCGAHTRR